MDRIYGSISGGARRLGLESRDSSRRFREVDGYLAGAFSPLESQVRKKHVFGASMEIETALAVCHGRIAGPLGAAAKLGIPRQTLASKIIKILRIDKHRFKSLHAG
jgi:formate hydrogenlyase transcriptional activator